MLAARRAAARCLLATAALLCGCMGLDDERYEVVYEQTCAEATCADDFAFSDPEAWHLHPGPQGPALELRGKSAYRPPHRSPLSIALIEGVEVRDFNLEVDLLQTGRNYGHRDLCLFFGFQSPSRFYYTHLATSPDANAHNIFLVNDAPRSNLVPPVAKGIEWGRDAWHHVRIERRVDAGTIKVFWNEDDAPVLTATDTTIGWGRVGFGSFDDSGLVRNVVLRAPAVRPAAGDPFRD